MKKLVLLFIVSILFTGCTNKNNVDESINSQNSENSIQDKQDTENSILYSNLIESSSQKEIIDILQKNGVTKEQTDKLLSWITDFNSRIKSSNLPEEFIPMKENKVDYSNLSVDIKQGEDDIISEVNCRLLSYLLMKNVIQTNGKQLDQDTFLMFDIELIDNLEEFKLNKEERDNFISLFNLVSVKDVKTLEEHIDKIKKAWEEREIKINSDKISLINVYLHDTFDQVRFVGHTGILLNLENKILFIEKYGPLYPFQATKFNNRQELKEYLLSRPDLYGDGTELAPIIMENNEVME